MTLINSLNIARKGLDVNEKKMETTSNNITNVNTPGYHKKRTISSSEYYQKLKGGFGGVKIDKFQRYENNFLLGNLLSSIAKEAGAKQRSDIMGQLEEIVGEPNGPITTSLNDLYDAFNDLSLNPDGKVEQKAVLYSAEKLATNFKAVDRSIINLRKDTLDGMKMHLSEANKLLQQVTKYNKAIRNDNEGSNVKDQLETVLSGLSEFINFKVHWRKDGTVALTSGGQFIADKQIATKLEVATDDDYNIKVISGRSGKEVNITDGKVAAGLEAFNSHIPEARKVLDELASAIITEINERHRNGYSENGAKGSDFFDNSKKTANSIDLAESIKNNPSNIAASPDGSAAASIAVIPEETNLTDILEKKVFDIALYKKGYDKDAQRHAAEKSTVETRYRSDVGVDLSEEVMEMVKQQRAYQASAQVLNTIKDMMDVVLGIAR
ncbi:MAG: flagellar hook-associated protein FlgK [Candidatus Zixiibacteriota bacterium]